MAALPLWALTAPPPPTTLQDARYSKLQQAENAKFEIFDIAPYGVPYALWGFIFILLTQAGAGAGARVRVCARGRRGAHGPNVLRVPHVCPWRLCGV